MTTLWLSTEASECLTMRSLMSACCTRPNPFPNFMLSSLTKPTKEDGMTRFLQ